MYESFFSLKQKPFSITSNPSFLYLSQRHKEALSSLTYGIRERVGFVQITGEVGTGKTTLCRALLRRLDERTKTAFIFNPDLTGTQLIQTIVQDLGIETARKDRGSLFAELNRFLLQQLADDNNVVVIIDEAQNLSSRALEQVRMLSNLEAEDRKLLQIVLAGQPELRKRLESPSLRQLRQRISVRYHIEPLDADEVPPYVEHRLRQAGADSLRPTFHADAYEEMQRYTKGIPRLINIVCDKSLLAAYAMEKRSIDREIIRRAIAETEGLAN